MSAKHLTVEGVMNALQKVKDKKTNVYVGVKGLTIPIVSVTKQQGDIYEKVFLNVESAWSVDDELRDI